MATLTTPRTRPSIRNLTMQSSSAGNTPTSQGASSDFEIGDAVEVPGNMEGTVRFVGEVAGKKGFFVGVELAPQYASRGKNSGDADGRLYFSTSIPGAGIFLPVNRAIKKDLPSPGTGSIPPTPTTPGFFGRTQGNHETSPTPAMPTPNFGKSLIGRAPSPALLPRGGRQSLPRPESPIRRTQMPAPPRPPSAAGATMRAANGHPGGQNRIVTMPRYTASPGPGKSVTKTPSKAALNKNTFRAPSRNGGEDDADEVSKLRRMVREKNERVQQLTAEFDGHRADFRKTLDALELAGEETQRVYESKIQELEVINEAFAHEKSTFMGEQGDVETVAAQLRQLEEVVQELEEGLEDARRGEAEARGEVEFLRGEVERLRAELRWEREQGERAKEERDREDVRSKSRSITNGTGTGTSKRISRQATPEPAQQQQQEEEEKKPETQAAPKEHVEHQVQPLQLKKVASPEPTTPILPKPTADEDKWCALCEQDGHDIMNCPNEDKL